MQNKQQRVSQQSIRDSETKMELGGPERASVGQVLHLYAHQFTLSKGGCDAELTRINHYLVGAGLSPLRRAVVDGRQLLEPRLSDIGSATPAGWKGHLDRRRSKRQATYALVREIGATTCSELATSKLRLLSTTMKAEGLSDSTIQKEVAVIKAAFNVAIREWGWRSFVNPAVGIRLGQSRQRFVRLTADEEQRLVDALSQCDQPEFWPMVELAITSTMRRGSLLALEWRNINLDNREVHVWAKGREVTLPLSGRSAELLRRIPRNGSEHVFSMSANAVKMAWCRIRTRACLPHLRFADLRHLGATFYARAGLNAHQLRMVLGHRTTKMAETYVNLVNTDVTEALDIAEAKRPIARPMPSSDVHAGRSTRAIVAERRAERLNGVKPLPANVIRIRPRYLRRSVPPGSGD